MGYPAATETLPQRLPDGTSLGTVKRQGEDQTPNVYLRWSDDRGRTWGNPIPQSIGGTGVFRTQPRWNRLGMARDRVFEAFGVTPGFFALNGAWIAQPIPLKS